MKIAIIHYWLVNWRGGEKVLDALCELFPEADIYTHVVDHNVLSATVKKHPINTTFIQSLPFATKYYQQYLPLMPMALEQLDLRAYDLIISSESGPAKGVLTSPNALHVCYCHTPMRYLWDRYTEYKQQAGYLTRLIMPLVFHYLRQWDFASAARVDHFVANSHYIAKRIRKVYRRDAMVIHPPVDTTAYEIDAEIGDYYLFVGQLVSYKRADLAVEAFNRLGKPLVILGEGEQLAKIRAMAQPNITILGRLSFAQMRCYYAQCRALIFPGEEDFGIVPVEAMASGRPVIAYKRGGALDTVKEGKTGIFFEEQSIGALVNAVERFETCFETFDPILIKQHAQQFDKLRFMETFSTTINEWLNT